MTMVAFEIGTTDAGGGDGRTAMKWRAGAIALSMGLAIVGGGTASAQPAPTDYATLAARSAALSPAEKSGAQALFSTGFALWQSGDFAAAAMGFKQGLDIDPANALANYYYGDCLARQKNKAQARDYLGRAVALGGTTAEALKARAELEALSAAPSNIEDMNAEELAENYVGVWHLVLPGTADQGIFRISRTTTGNWLIEGSSGASKRLEKINIDGRNVVLVTRSGIMDCSMTYTGTLTGLRTMGGTAVCVGMPYQWTADKQ